MTDGLYRLSVASQVLRIWNVVRGRNIVGSECWKVVSSADTFSLIDLDSSGLVSNCEGFDYEVGWKDPGNPLVKINWVPRPLPRNTPILVSDRYEENKVVFLSYGQIVDGKMAWTVNVDDIEKRFFAVPRPLDTVKAAGDDLNTGIRAALDQSGLTEQLQRLQSSLTAVSEEEDLPEEQWKLALHHVSWPMHWAWEFYVTSPNPIRLLLREQAAAILVRMAKEMQISNEVVGRYLTNLTWDEVAATDPTLLEINEFRLVVEEADELFQKRAGMNRDDAYARLWWRRRGKDVFETFRTTFLKTYPPK